jgi:hypothetical protein
MATKMRMRHGEYKTKFISNQIADASGFFGVCTKK